MWSFLYGGEAEKETTKHTTLEDETEKTVEEALECDYERDCTPLYKKIEEEEWEAIAKFLDSGYWPGNFFQDSVPPTDQARTWVTRFDPADKKKVRWSQLPLHLAIVVEAPYEIVVTLLDLYPQAIRCTDDQHMLPLHLAMRHGSSDEIVDYLISLFPEAINAKGKNDRTPIECAKRAPNKIRGRILDAFVEKSKRKSEKVTSQWYIKEMAVLKDKLEGKNNELEDIKAKLSAMETSKEMIELNLKKKIDDLQSSTKEISNKSERKVKALESEKIEEEIRLQKRIEQLESLKKEMEQAQEKAIGEEANLKKQLENIQTHVARSTSPEDLEEIKREVDALKAYRLQHSRTKAHQQMEELRAELEYEMRATNGKTSADLQNMQKTVEELRNSQSRAKTSEELDNLRSELETLRKELKDREAASRTKVELVVLKKALEKELKDSEGKTFEEIETMRRALAGMNVTELQNKTTAELSMLKEELESMKKEMREKDLATKTKKDYEELKDMVARELKAAVGETKEQLAAMKAKVESLGADKLENKSNDELIAVKQELDTLKEEMYKREHASTIKDELAALKKSLENELKHTQGKTQDELDAIKAAVKSMNESKLDDKSSEELEALQTELNKLKDEITFQKEAKKTKDELSSLKDQISRKLKSSSGSEKSVMAALKSTADAIDVKSVETMDALRVIQSEIESLRSDVEGKSETKLLSNEIMAMKKTLEKEFKHSERSDKVLAKIDAGLGDYSLEQLTDIMAEIEAIKKTGQEKKEISQEMNAIKEALEYQLAVTVGKTRDELVAIKKTVDEIDLGCLETENRSEWLELKAKLASLKQDLKETEEVLKTQQDLEALKKALEEELNNVEGKSKNELLVIKNAVDALDITELSTQNKDEWSALKIELSALKKDMKEKELQMMKATLETELKSTEGRTQEELDALKKAFAAIDIGSLEHKTLTELELLKREIEELKSQVPDKKSKNPLKKMFSRLGFGGRKKSNSKDGVKNIQQSGSHTIYPPSAQNAVDISHSESTDNESTNAKHISANASFSSKRSYSSKRSTVSKSAVAKTFPGEPIPVVRTYSKPVVKESGDIELEPTTAI